MKNILESGKFGLNSAKISCEAREMLQLYSKWMIKYFWFLKWIHKVFSCIQNDIITFSSTSLHHTALQILKNEIFVPLNNDILKTIFTNLDMFKEG